jgi:hypothetical protein
MRWSEIEQQELLEAGLERLRQHLRAGRSLGIISAWKRERPEAIDAAHERRLNDEAHQRLIRRLRELRYGPIQSTGRSEWGPERSVVVPNVALADLKQLGNEFEQDAVIFVPPGKKTATRHHLQASETPGRIDVLGPEHFNTPNPKGGITVLKGIGYDPRDPRNPTRYITFGAKRNGMIESLTLPPLPPLHPHEKPYR